MTYEEAVRVLKELQQKEPKRGLSRIELLLDRMGRPDEKFPSIIVSGTNGKGSTCVFLSSLLRKAGLKVGLYTSPHLLEWNERMVINGSPVSPEKFGEAVGEALRVSEGMDDEPTLFEVLTAAAMWLFPREGVDIVVLEVGKGGRMDATNASRNVVGSIVSNVGLDHTDCLGDTIEKIAFEKAGIARHNRPFVTAARPEEGRATLLEVAHSQGASPVVLVGEDEACQAKVFVNPDRSFSLEFGGWKVELPKPGMEGPRQALNAACAAVCVNLLGIDITREAMREAISGASLLGRFQMFEGNPTVVFDVAHNAEAAHHLAETFASRFPGKKALLVCTMFSDKPHQRFGEAIQPIVSRAFLAPMVVERPLPVETLAERFREGGLLSIHTFPSIRAAFEAALSEAEEEEIVLVCGSFVTVCEALRAFHRKAGI